MDTVLGVDACRAGWIGITWAGDKVEAHFAKHIAELADLATVIAIDIPIGLPDSGCRQADVEARAFLSTRRASVFMTPVRTAVELADHAEASTENRKRAGKGISIQSHSLRKKILEVDEWCRTTPNRVVEVHPEVSFTELAGPDIHLASKKTWAGANQRMALLTKAGLDLFQTFGEAGRRAAVDDLLDAAAAAWTARRVLNDEAIPLPTTPETFSDRVKAAIWR